jgi:UDP-N-acetylmuramate dehydrogenase
MDWPDDLGEIVTAKAPLGSRTCFKVGGSADYLVQPRSVDELARTIRACRSAGQPFRVLGAGSNSLISDDGYAGVAIELAAPEFQKITIDNTHVTCGAGLMLADLISATCKAGLSGLESLVGIPGTVGGAVCKNSGGRGGDIGQYVDAVDVLTADAKPETRSRSAIRFGYRSSDLDDAVVVAIHLKLLEDDPEDVVRRIKRIWIEKKAHQPFGFQNAGYAFRNPRGLSAAELIDKAGLRGTKVGGAELSERDVRYVVAHPNATSRDVRQLIDLVTARVEEQTGVELELQIDIW